MVFHDVPLWSLSCAVIPQVTVISLIISCHPPVVSQFPCDTSSLCGVPYHLLSSSMVSQCPLIPEVSAVSPTTLLMSQLPCDTTIFCGVPDVSCHPLWYLRDLWYHSITGASQGLTGDNREMTGDTTPSVARVYVISHHFPRNVNPKNFPFKEQSCCNSSANNMIYIEVCILL